MTNKNATKKALLSSVLALVLCFSMLLGTTYAWFTDSVTSSGNIIKSGTLEVLMDWAKGTDDPAAKETVWNDASKDPIFNYNLWEPGYVDVKHIRVTNDGTLALKYQLFIEAVDAVGILADVIDVYMFDGGKQITGRTDLVGVESKGTLTEVIANFKSLTYGELAAETSKTFTIALKMQETAGNEYQDKSIGTSFAVKLLATQLTAEKDSFDNQYDDGTLVCDVLATPANAQEIINAAAKGTVIGLAEGTYGDLVIQDADGNGKTNITLVAKKAVVASVNLNGSTNITIDGLTFDADKGTTVWTYSKGTTSDYGMTASITDATKDRSYYGAKNITVSNCKFTYPSGVSTRTDVSTYACIATINYRSSQANANYTIKNCDFACNAQNYLMLHYVNGEIVVEGNTFGGGEYGTNHNTINATSSGANWTITGNTFNNWNAAKTAIGSSRSSLAGILTWTVTDNVFNGPADAVVLALKVKDITKQESYNDKTTAVVFERNTALNGNGVLVDTTRNAEDDEDIYKGKKIALKEGVAAVTSPSELSDALTNEAPVIVLMDDVTVIENWNSKDLMSGITSPVTIDGMGNTIKFTGNVNDRNNFSAALRFETAATVKNLTIDMSEASSSDIRLYAISAKSDLTVDNCTFIGCDSHTIDNAIIFGHGVGTATIDMDVSITNCTFVNWRRGITDNENGKDVKSVVIKNNTLTNADVYLSAYESVTFTGNEMDGSVLNITSYTAASTLKVVVTDNTLDTNEDHVIGNDSKLFDPANVTCQEGVTVYTIE